MKAALFITALLFPVAAAAQTSVFPLPSGLKLADSGGPTYSTYGLAPYWTVNTFARAVPLPPFIGNVSEDANGSVALLPGGQIAFKSDGRALGCKSLQNGTQQVREFDEMADPPIASSKPPLSVLHHAYLAGTVLFKPSSASDLSCKTTMLSVADSLILKNEVNGQILFYQLKLAGASQLNGRTTLRVGTKVAASWFSRGISSQAGKKGGQQFGYDDSLSVYTGGLIPSGGQQSYRIDVLPTLLRLITRGPDHPQVEIDADPSHWVIVEEYVSQAVWGHMGVQTTWSDLSLIED